MQTVTGSIQPKRNILYAVIRVPTLDGDIKQIWKSTGIPQFGKTKRETTANEKKANLFLAALINEYQQKRLISNRSFVSWIDAWLDNKRKIVRQNTYEMYASYISKHIKPFFEPLGLRLNEVTVNHIKHYFDVKIDEGQSINTLKKHKVVLSSVFEFAIDATTQDASGTDAVNFNPAKRYKFERKAKRFRGTAYTAQQVNTLLDAAKDDVIFPAVMLAINLGLRRSECLGLRWEDIDFQTDVVHIRNTIVQDNKGCRIEDLHTKSEESRRDLSLTSTLKAYLEHWQHEQERNKKLLGNEYHDTGGKVCHICTYPDGRPILPTVLSRRFTLIVTRHNLPPIRFHDLRHTAASILIEGGMTPKAVQEFLGHSDIQTTYNIYGHSFDSQKKKVANCLENALNNVQAEGQVK